MPIPAFGLIRGNLERTAILCFKVNIVGELTIEIPSRKEIIFEGFRISTFTTLMAFWNVTRANKND